MKADHLPALDGLRGFAALVVVVGHCAAFGFLPEFLSRGLGQMGVALFFGLSGFLMAYLYCGKALGPDTLKEYAVNRASRVLPLYFLVASFVAFCFVAFDVSLLKVFSWKDIAGNMLLLKGTSVLWTIPVEIHFYVVFVALWFAANHGKFMKAVVLLGAVQLSSLVALYAIGIDYSPVLFSWLHLFLFGSLLGAHYDKLKRAIDGSRLGALLSGFAWVVVVLGVIAPPQLRRDFGVPTLINFLDPVTAGYPMLLLACTVFLLGPFAIFRQPILRWFGAISYSLYLLHPFVIDGVTAIVDMGILPVQLGFPVVLSVATLLAAASFYFIENPVQRMLRRHFAKNRQEASFA